MWINPKEDLILYVCGHIEGLKKQGLIKTNLKLTANARKKFGNLLKSGYYADSDTVKGVITVLKQDPDIFILYSTEKI